MLKDQNEITKNRTLLIIRLLILLVGCMYRLWDFRFCDRLWNSIEDLKKSYPLSVLKLVAISSYQNVLFCLLDLVLAFDGLVPEFCSDAVLSFGAALPPASETQTSFFKYKFETETPSYVHL